MPRFLAASLAAAVLSLTLRGTALADTDPTVHQIYEAASTGHLDRAQQMMDQVLRDHPDSAKAHYVQSELYARQGKLALARAELDRAEELSPGLPKENPRSVAELRSELGLTRRGYAPTAGGGTPTLHFHWGTVLIVLLVLGLIWTLFRRRTSPIPHASGGVPAATPGPSPASSTLPGGYAGGGPVAGGGIGSTMAGGLAGGLAAGAGLVAGEALAHRLLDGDHPVAPGPPAADDRESNAANSDMGGADFGVNDPDSWDDGSGGDQGGGGDDWT
jgi:uncharacterized protein